MKNLILFIIMILLIYSPVNGFAKGQSVSPDINLEQVEDGENTLILYYSKMGTTRTLAEEAGRVLPSAELVEIKSDVGLMKAAFWQQLFNKNAVIEEISVDMSKYDKVILLSPIWLQKIASPSRTVINTLPLSNIKVKIIITCGGHFGEGAQEKLKKHVESKGAEILNLFVVKTGGKTEEELKAVVRTLL